LTRSEFIEVIEELRGIWVVLEMKPLDNKQRLALAFNCVTEGVKWYQ
jgi:hypothetical protein